MTLTRGTGLTLLALATWIAAPRAVAAQDSGARRPIELGIDAALTYESADDVKATVLTLPVPSFRVGFFLSNAISLEPALSLRYARLKIENPISGEERTTSGTSYDLNLGLLYHFGADRVRSQPYLRPFLGIRGFSGDNNSGSQTSLGAAFGVKFPAAERLGTRLEVGFTHRLEDEPEFQASNQLFLSFGLSFFTH